MGTQHPFHPEPLTRFFYWMKERHSIYVKREVEKKPAPWTKDEVLQTQFFTNPYRENDKTTVWFRENIRHELRHQKSVLFATLLFRWFNSIPTGEFLISDALTGTNKFNPNPLRFFNPNVFKASTKVLKRVLTDRQDAGNTLFGGAYIIKLANGVKKHHSVIDTLHNLIKDGTIEHLENVLWGCDTLEYSHRYLQTNIPFLGPFMAYEIICDLRYTDYLDGSWDTCKWANPGPGAFRGLRRLLGLPVENRMDKSVPGGRKVAIELMRTLLLLSHKKVGEKSRGKLKLKNLEMREIEHSLCEFDKYERARTGIGGRMKRKFIKGE
tara:strand:- start:10108 stop:11079 length:972 start_codon:yes stop_codon:yes gene_type:complete